MFLSVSCFFINMLFPTSAFILNLFEYFFYRNFTPILCDFYNELTKDSEEPLEIVFVSADNSPEELMGYMNDLHGDWLAVQHGAVLAE